MKATADCPNMAGCEMFAMLRLAGTLEVWKNNYCTTDFKRCERYKLSVAGRPVPPNMLPTGTLLRHAVMRK